MNKVTRSFMFYSITLFAVLLLSPTITSKGEQLLSMSTTVRVEPAAALTSLGDTMTINITVVDVSDLAGWEFKLYWLGEKLNGTGIVEGSFLKTIGSTYFNVINFTDNHNSTHGLAWVSTVLLGPGPGAYGSGTLASISFKAKNIGSTGLWLTDTMLVDSAANLIPHNAVSGTAYIGLHDIAITNVTSTKTVIGQGFTMNIDVTVTNEGNFTEIFNVTVYANMTTIASQTSAISSGNHTTLTFTWNTTGFANGNYTLSAYATPAPGETDTTDNRLIDGWVTVSIIGDVNADKIVDVFDLIKVGIAFGSKPGDANWNPNADLKEDNVIDVFDLVKVAIHFGETSP